MDFPLQWYDLLMLAVLILSTLFGAWKGMAWQLAAVASLVVSAAVALHYGGSLVPYLSLREPWNRFVAMLVLYLATSLAIWIIFRLVARIIDRVQLKEFDRQVGALFGAAKGVLWCAVITFFAVLFSDSAREKVLRTRSGYYTALLIHRAGPVLPPELRHLLGGYIDEFNGRFDPKRTPVPTRIRPGGASRGRGPGGAESRGVGVEVRACCETGKTPLFPAFRRPNDRT